MPHVLLVDDLLVRKLHGQVLAHLGFEIRLAATAPETFAALDEQMPDVVILISVLPDISGIQLLQQLKSAPRTMQLPIMMMTGCADHDFQKRVIENGAADFLVKPWRPQDVASRINLLLKLPPASTLTHNGA